MKENFDFANWRHWLKWGTVIFTVLFIARQLFAFAFVTHVFNFINNVSSDIKIASHDDMADADAAVARIQAEMLNGSKQIAHDAKDMQKDFDSFNKEFNSSLNKKREKDKNQASFNMDKVFSESIKTMDKTRENFIKKIEAEDRAREREKKHQFTLQMKPYIECEKKLYGKTTFDPNDTLFYDPFPFGLPEKCKGKRTAS